MIRTVRLRALAEARPLLVTGLVLVAFSVGSFAWANHAGRDPNSSAGEDEALFAVMVGGPIGMLGVGLVLLAAVMTVRARRRH